MRTAMRFIPLSNSPDMVSVDEDIYDLLSMFSWRKSKNGYAVSNSRFKGKQKYMHRVLCDGEVIHHINENKLDNRSENLEPQSYLKHNAYHQGGEKNWHRRSELRSLFSGENSPHHKLTLSQIVEIRKKYVPKKYSQRRIAKEFGVCQRQIGRILRDESWRAE